MGETKTCLHLFDISQYRASGEMKRIGSGVGGCVQFRKSWFEAAEPPCAREVECFSHTVPQKQKYTLRQSRLPDEMLIWDAHGGVDRYTGRLREDYSSMKTPVHRDHVLEVQMLETVLDTAFPWTGSLDARGVEVARQVLFPFLNGNGEFRKELLNLNNTEDILNQYWKGGSVRLWRKHFHETGGDVKVMRQRLGGDASLAGLLRASMRVDSDGQALQALAVDKWKGRGARAQASYRPSWTRAVDAAMGLTGRKLVERLSEHDGETHFLLVAEALEDVLRKMELKGFTR
ncbi:MAG: hypothetical protein EBR09_07585 [Proteobacteria bacterium]|nr:hypothetical protein [Pseudomonadota bacterium]